MKKRSSELFRQAADMNANLEYAYDGIGKSLLRQGEYKEAVHYFRQAMDRTNYSKAYLLYRKEVMRNFPDDDDVPSDLHRGVFRCAKVPKYERKKEGCSD